MAFPKQQPTFDKGRGATFTEPSMVEMQGTPKYAGNIELGAAVGLHNTLRFSYNDIRATGNIQSTPGTLHLWDQTYDPGTYLATTYRVQNAQGVIRLSDVALSRGEPAVPPEDVMAGAIHVDSDGLRRPEGAAVRSDHGRAARGRVGQSHQLCGHRHASGSSTRNSAWGRHITAGRHFRWEANASGFTWPHHSTVWDADTSANLKYGHLELRVGAKAFHFKTSTQRGLLRQGHVRLGFRRPAVVFAVGKIRSHHFCPWQALFSAAWFRLRLHRR